MEEDPAVFLKACTRDSLAPGMLSIEWRGPQYDVLAVEGAVALASGHGGLVRVIPHGGEAIRFGIEDGDSGGLRSVIIDEGYAKIASVARLSHSRADSRNGLGQ